MAHQRKLKNDPLIEGTIVLTDKNPCDHCQQEEVCITVKTVHLPKGLPPGKTLIAFHEVSAQGRRKAGLQPVRFLGVTCGCYAKFHRQIVHITT